MTLRLPVSTPWEGTNVNYRLLISALGFALIPAIPAAAQSSCATQSYVSGGDIIVTRFIAAPVPRVHEAVADAMQGNGVLLFRNSEQSVEGERAVERVKVLGLPSGDDAIQAKLEPSTSEGTAGTMLRVETLRGQNKKGSPKHVWSTAVVDHTSCLISLLSLDDPLHRAAVPDGNPTEVHIPDSAVLEVRSRHFFFNADIRAGQTIEFETASPLVVSGKTVAPSGLLVVASMDQLSDIKEFGRAAKGELSFKYLVMPDGTRVPLRGEINLSGKSTTKQNVGDETARLAATAALVAAGGGGSLMGAGAPGRGFAVLAGTLTTVRVAGDHVVRVVETKNTTPPEK